VTTYSLGELSDANQVLWDFLDALRAGDEDTVRRLLFPASARRLGGPADDVAGSFLDAWAVPPDELARLGIVHSARILDDELVAFGIIVGPSNAVGDFQLIDGPTPARALALIKSEDGDNWQVWGVPPPDLWSKPRDIVPLPAPGASGPIH
jgi:hypothetical protein